MANQYFTVEDLLLDESFTSYCLKRNAADILKWETIIHSQPHFESTFSEAERLVTLLHSGLSENEIDTELQNIQGRILQRQTRLEDYSEEAVAEVAASGRKPFFQNKWVYTGVAASILFCMFLFFGNRNEKAVTISHLPANTVSSETGNRKKVLLPDGTEVTLNSHSSVSWNEAYNLTDRQINLTGSAFFKVAKNAEKPFIVHSGSLSTTALGTAFYVQQLPSKEDVQVSLLEGKINVEEKDNTRQNIVYPGEEMVYNSSSRLLQKRKFNTRLVSNWLSGELSFTNMALKDVMNELSFWYNVNIQLQNTSLADKPVTGKYQDAPLDDVLKVISFSLGFTYTSSGNTVIIR